jgi:EAL domain-containing protein (putative c-di-GMP-specific phosphodiesterase class I)
MFEASNEGLSGERALIEGDLAMYDAKEAGRDRYAFFASTEHSRTHARLTWISRIEQALQNDGFVLVAQPILDLRSGRVTQYELLLRMLDQDGALIPPAAFLKVAERFELIGRIDQWVVVHAIELIDRQPRLQLHVNISGKSLGDQRLLQTIDGLLNTSSFDPSHLTFEVTETAAIANITHAQTFAQRLRDHGCQFALDDFGAGFGSFYYLKHLPFDSVKIDGDFVQHTTNGQIDRLVIDAVVRIARGLRKTTVAEYVASPATQRMVRLLGVDYAQGYQIGKPAPLPDPPSVL